MTQRKKSLLLSALDASLSPNGFSAARQSWFRRSDEIIEVVNLQKSQFSAQHHLNFALWILSLAPASLPQEHECHLRMRVQSVLGPDAGIERLLDLDSDIPDSERMHSLRSVLDDAFLPLADRCQTVEGLRALWDSGKFAKVFVHASARRILSD